MGSSEHIWGFQSVDDSIISVRARLSKLASAATTKSTAPRVLVVAIDGIPFELAKNVLHHGRISCLTTTFPSTTTNAYLSSILGCGADYHGVWGPVMRIARTEDDTAVFNLLRDRCFRWGDDWATGGEAVGPAQFQIPEHTSLFHDWCRDGYRPFAITADYPRMSNEWTSALYRGAQMVIEPSSRSLMTQDPVQHFSTAFSVAKSVLNNYCAVWVLINLDLYIHKYGYDEQVLGVLQELDVECARLAEQGVTLVCYSDHGLVPTTAPPEHLAVWEYAESPSFCRARAGGAGRTRWLYPHHGREQELIGLLQPVLAPDALVLLRDEVVARGLVRGLGDTPMTERIGEIIVTAVGNRFPLPDPNSTWEHGGITSTEMLVPFVNYGDA